MLIPDYTVKESVKQYSTPWNISLVKAPSFWSYSRGGGRVVAIIDTGLDVNHHEFKGRVLADFWYQREWKLPEEGDIDGAIANFKMAEGVLFKHIRSLPNSNPNLTGRGILDLSFDFRRWPLHRVQVGAYYYPEGANKTEKQIRAANFEAFRVKY